MKTFTASERDRYSRHFILDGFGEEAQIRLKRSSVLVVGAGGLGSPLLPVLAAAGIGKITVADDDQIELSNLQRQVLYTSEQIGNSKAEAASRRMREINPFISVNAVTQRITEKNVRELIREYDLVVDGTDNFHTRYLINDACVLEGKPWVFGAIYKYEGQVTVFNYNDGPTYRCLFPDAPENIPSCSEAGVLGPLTSIVGSLMANEVVKCLAKVGDVLSGRLLCIDSLSLRFTELSFEPVAAKKKLSSIEPMGVNCSLDKVDASTFRKYLESENVLFIDVREVGEEKGEVPSAIQIPLYSLEEMLNELPQAEVTILFCEKGIRSDHALKILRAGGRKGRMYSLQGGMSQYRSLNG